MASKSRYESVNSNDEAEDGDTVMVAKYRDSDDISTTDSGHKMKVLDGPESSFLPTRRNRAICACQKLTRSCIATCVAVAVLSVIIIISGGYFSYKRGLIDGQSPPRYPSPPGGTLSSWESSYRKAQAMVEKMSLVEKVNITTGTGWAMDLCVGNTGAAVEAGFPALCLQDGPLGIRFADHADSFPAGITTGSTWNRELMRKRGEAHGLEAKMKGVNVLLGPSMGPLGRNPAGGRNWEGFGSDPVLQGIAAAETIKGIQSQGVMATAKHLIGNEQEHFRKSFEWGLPEALSSNIDDRTLHELYLWPFAESIKAGVVSVMCSYQMVNNSYSCQNSWLMNGLLKDELGFQGYVQSDWLAQRSGVASALAGLDMSMPGDGIYWMDGKSLFGEQLTLAVLNGSIPIERLNDMATRVVAAWYQVGQDKWESIGPNFSSWTNETTGKLHDAASDSKDTGVVNQHVRASSHATREIARKVAQEGIVLLKNEDDILPLSNDLKSLKTNGKVKVMVVGEDAGPGKGPNFCNDRACNQGTLGVGWGSGSTEFMYLIDPLKALTQSFDGASVTVENLLSNKLSKKDKQTLKEQHLCLVFANADAGEGHLAWQGVRADRNALDLQKDGSKLIKAVTENCGGPVIAIIHTVGPVVLEDFADHPKVKAILNANLPGQESGHALTDVLFGVVDASGRLAYTIGKTLEDYGPTAPVLYYPNRVVPQVDFQEGLYIDYRYFDKQNIAPRYEFGFGLSYANFEYSNLLVKSMKKKTPLPTPRPHGIEPPKYVTTLPDARTALFPEAFRRLKKYVYPYIEKTSQIKSGKYPYPRGYDMDEIKSQAGGGEGGNPSLFDVHAQITVDIHNSASRAGKEVIQLYVAFPDGITDSVNKEPIDTPVKVLRDFDKILLSAGETTSVKLNLTRKDLSYWSTFQQTWVMPVDGEFTIMVGRSSRDIKLVAKY